MRYFLIGVFVSWLAVVGLIMLHEQSCVDPSMQLDTGDRTTIVFWHAMGGPLGTVMDNLVDRYNNSQKQYFVKTINMGSYNVLSQKILASLVANEAPDIAQNFETLTIRLIKHNKIVCLDELIDKEPEDMREDVIPVLLDNNTYDGKLYSFPFNKSVPVIYYNKDIFEKVGLDPERPPQTMEEFASCARIITNYHKNTPGEDKAIYGFGISRSNVWAFLNRIIQFGGVITSEDYTTSYFDSQPVIDALAFHQDMLKEGIAKEGQGLDHQADFLAGSAAMIEASIVSKVFMERSIKFRFGVAPLPMYRKKGVILSGTNINIFSNPDPKKVAGAWDFVKWFTSTDVTAEWSVRTTYLPVRKSALETEYFKEAHKKDPNLTAPYVQLDYCYFEPRISAWFDIRDLVADHLERATLHMGPPEEYCNAMKQDADALLKYATK